MNKKTLIIAGGSILGILLLLILVVWLMTVFKGKYLSYEKVEDKIVEATKKYYKEKPELLPVTDGRYTLSYDTLVEGEYIKPLNEMLRDGDNCTAEIYVIKSGSDYTYAPKLDCGDNYTSVELYKQVLAKTDIVDVGSGLYQDEDGNYYFKGKVSNNYVALGHKKVKKETKDILWQIISISSDGTIKIRSTEPTEEKYLYDNRFNKDRNSDSGYNDFEDSVLHE